MVRIWNTAIQSLFWCGLRLLWHPNPFEASFEHQNQADDSTHAMCRDL